MYDVFQYASINLLQKKKKKKQRTLPISEEAESCCVAPGGSRRLQGTHCLAGLEGRWGSQAACGVAAGPTLRPALWQTC